MRRGIMNWLACLAGMAVVLAEPATASETTKVSGPAQLTVIGNIAKTNRGPFDPFDDAFLKFREKEFQKAFAFSRAALEALPQQRVTIHAEGWPGAIAAEGPTLADVLAAAGVDADATVGVVALDGYTVDFDAAARAAQGWVLAISSGGKPLSIGGRGPAWLVYDTGGKPAAQDVEAQWVWSVFLIEVQ